MICGAVDRLHPTMYYLERDHLDRCAITSVLEVGWPPGRANVN